jgi:hypothetical protein
MFNVYIGTPTCLIDTQRLCDGIGQIIESMTTSLIEYHLNPDHRRQVMHKDFRLALCFIIIILASGMACFPLPVFRSERGQLAKIFFFSFLMGREVAFEWSSTGTTRRNILNL